LKERVCYGHITKFLILTPQHVVVQQVNELNIIRQSLYDLESQHNKVRQHFEEELARARSELSVTKQQLAAATTIANASQPGSGATVGPGAPSQILPVTAHVASGPPYPTGSEPTSYSRDYPRDRPVERDPRGGERSTLGPHGAERGMGPSTDRERSERERLDRERDNRERERERPSDPKRVKNDRLKASGEFLLSSGS